MIKQIKFCNRKDTILEMQPFIPSTIVISMKDMKGCKDMHIISWLITKKREPVKPISKWNDEGLVMQTDAKYLIELLRKLHKNQNIICCNLRSFTNLYLTNLKINRLKILHFLQETETIEHLSVDLPYVKENVTNTIYIRLKICWFLV